MKKQLFLLYSFICSLNVCFATVEAFEVGPDQADQLPKGKEADGIVGDFILRNELVTAVIAGNQPLRRANMGTFYGEGGTSQGCLYDFTLNKRHNDQLTVYTPGRQRGPISHIRVNQSGEDFAEIEVVVSAAKNKGLYKKHTYQLHAGAKGLVVTTFFRNENKVGRKISLDDYWKPSGKSGTFNNVRWVDAVDPSDKGSYAVGWLDGAAKGSALIKRPSAPTLKHGESRTVTRFIAVGNSPADAYGNVIAYTDSKHSILELSLRDEAEASSTGSATVAIASGNQLIPAYPSEKGHLTVGLPHGSYSLSITDRGRKPVKMEVLLANSKKEAVKIPLSKLSGVKFKIDDESGRDIPCKVQFVGTGETPTPNLGPQNRAHGCVDQWHSETGEFEVALDPGSYRLVITRGIEYGHLIREIKVQSGKFTLVQGSLKRLVDSSGWVSTDFHNHSTPSGDNQCGTDDRIINLAAEHIEFAPTTEHNRLYDWAPHIEKLGLSHFLSTIVGLELTGRGAGSHHNAFPLPKPNPFAQDGGAPVFQTDPRLNAIALQNFGGWDPDRWVHINHPNLSEKFWDRNQDGKADGGFVGYSDLINGIESQNFRGNDILATAPWKITRVGPRKSVREVREFIWLQMLNQGLRTRAIAVADAHSVYGNGVGGWRTYIPSSSDAPSKIDSKEIIQNAKAGRLMLTTGPYLEVTANGVRAGSEIPAGSGKVKLKIKVQCTDWVDIDRVQVLVNGRQVPEHNYTRKSHPDFFGNDVIKFDRALELQLKNDAHIIVVAMGEEHNLRTGYGTSTNSQLRPCAYINPIWVDVDGKGFQHNGDTLDWPLPVSKPSAEKFETMLEERKKS